MKKSSKQYCVYCGEENNIKDKRCSKCHRKLNPKSHDFLDYLKNHIKSDLKSNVEDKAFSIITNYLKSHLYGLILTFSVIASATVVVHVNAIDNGVQKVESKPTNIEETIKYAGEGLSLDEVVNLYVDALANKDMNLVKSLQYDTFFEIDSNIQEQIDKFSNTQFSLLYSDYQSTLHDLADKMDIYFKDYNYFIIDSNDMFDRYITEYVDFYHDENSYIIGINYCSYKDKCDYYSGNSYGIYQIIRVIEVDGNNYILQEVPVNSTDESLFMIRTLMHLEGDVSSVSLSDLYDIYYNTCNKDNDCYKEVCSKYVQ